jgi:excisionase family DNA binding protein
MKEQMMEKLLYTINEAVAATGLGRTTLYNHIGSGHLPVVKIGDRTCISAEALKEFVSKDWPIPTTYKTPN